MAGPGPLDAAFERFASGVSAIFRQWTALRLAVDHCDNPDAPQIAAQMESDLISWFREEGPQAEIYSDEVDEFLFETLAQELCADVQDGSPTEVARLTCSMFKECMALDFTSVLKAEQAAARGAASSASREVVPALPPPPADSEAMAEDMDEGDAPDAAPATPAPLPAPRPPRGPKKPTAAVDADGWQTVGPRRG